MLNDFQINRVWQSMLAAETRALYFGDLTSSYTKRKQFITGATFFLSSGAAATLIGKAPGWMPIVLSVAVALLGAYSMAVGLDRKISTLAKLHASWERIATEYAHLWSHTSDPDAEDRLEKIEQLAKEPSELATTEAPNDQERIRKWQDVVFGMHELTNINGQ
jgi:hypothetical protein